MSIFNLQSSRMYPALRAHRVFSAVASSRFVAILLGAMVIVGLVYIVAPHMLSASTTLGLVLLMLPITFSVWVYHLYFVSYLAQARFSSPQASENLADHLDFEAAEVMDTFQKTQITEISSILEQIFSIPRADFILFRIGIHPSKFRRSLVEYLKTAQPTDKLALIAFLEDALSEAKQVRSEAVINWRDLLVTLSVHSEFLKQLLFDLKLDKSDLRAVAYWQWAEESAKEHKRQFWRKENLLAHRGVGKGWAAGYTVTLDKYATDVTEILEQRGFTPQLFGRVAETEAIEQILARAGKNNVVVVGEAGVGKKTIIYALARKILDGNTIPSLSHKRVLELDAGAVLAGAEKSEVEARFRVIMNEASKSGNVILLIDNIHALFSSGSGAGIIDATALFLPYLSGSALQVVGLTDYEGYHNTIANSTSVVQAFEKVEIHELPKFQVMPILQIVTPHIEDHSHVLILYQAIKAAIELCDRYIKDEPFPEKAINVLQQAAVHAQSKRKSSQVTAEDIEEVVHRKTEIPVGKIAAVEREVLLDLENVLHRRVIGQDEAISAIANSLRRARSGIVSAKRPIGSFLFLGPTGVGKTETAKTLAAVYFGSEKQMLRFDMSEFQQADSIDRLIGGSANSSGQLTLAVTENPFSLLLLDEIEKAHPDILNVFLQVLDDGRLTDATGRTVDFTNTIIIATSNAGSEMIRESVQQFREANLKERLLHHLQTSGIFRPEFLNRFDAVIVYRPLTTDQTEEVTKLLLAELNQRLGKQDIQITITKELVQKVAALGYDPAFGARPLRRVIQDKIESTVAKRLLSGEIQRGQQIVISPQELDQ